MGDHFVLLVDRLLTESTLEAAIERNALKQTVDDIVDYPACIDGEDSLSPRKVKECRICQDEDFDLRMETPCSCRGSLKYAHRKCIQRWCNEKGDTTCEICHQQFKPGYTAPPPIFRLGALSMNLRGNWQISGRDVNNPRIIRMISTDSSTLDEEDDEDHAASTSRRILCCRVVAIIFTIILILRHTFPIIVSHAGNYSFPLIMLLMLRITGIIVPICIILKAVTSILHRRNQQQANIYFSSSDEETGRLTLPQPDVTALR